MISGIFHLAVLIFAGIIVWRYVVNSKELKASKSPLKGSAFVIAVFGRIRIEIKQFFGKK